VSKTWKWSILMVSVLALLGLAGWQSVEHLWETQNGAKYRMAKVERGEIAAYVSATGTLNPVIMVQVGTQVSGTIEKLFVDFNSTVVPGQQLAQLDQASFRAKVVQVEANLDNARAEVKNAVANVHNVRASIELSNGHRIQSDFPELRVTTEGDWPGTGSATAEGSLNGGGPLLKVRTTTGDIRILRAH